jgi:hypothetical protein
MSLSRLAVGVALVCVMGWSSGVWAASPPGTSGNNAQHDNHSPAAANAQPVYVDGFGPAVSAGALGHYSGGGSLVQNTANLTGTVSNDTATNVATGDNSITGDSFAGASGLPSVIQNSGNNVLIQNGIVVNVQMKP